MSDINAVTCFGVTFNRRPVGPGKAGAQSLVRSEQLTAQVIDEAESLNKCFELSIKETLQSVNDDLSGQPRTVQSAFLPGAGQDERLIEINGVSVLEDCGLPLVAGRFGGFLNRFLENEVSANNIPFVGLDVNTSNSLWSPGILPINPVRHRDLLNYNEQLYYLTRLNSSDSIWDAPRKKAWINSLGKELTSYTKELFSGRFVDRNGVANSFSAKDIVKGALQSIQSFDAKAISVQVVGNLMSVLTEYIGDKLFSVPFYSAEILKKNRDFRSTKTDVLQKRAQLKILIDGVIAGSISVADAKKILKYDIETPDPLVVKFDSVINNGVQTSIVKSELARLVNIRISELDLEVSTLLKDLSGIVSDLDDVDNGLSELKTVFTCYSTGVIKDHLHCIFTESSAQCGRDKNTGNKDDVNKDYSDLLGALIAFGATLAEKNIRSLMGGIIRGISIASLQNEVVAELLSAIAAGLAKKAVENVIYKGFHRFISERGGAAALPVHSQIFLERLSIEHKVTKDWSEHLKTSVDNSQVKAS